MLLGDDMQVAIHSFSSLFVGRIGILYLKKLPRHEAQEKQKHTCMYTMYKCTQIFESICKRRQG